MSKYIFKSDLSTDGVQKLIDDLINYKKDILQRKINLLAKTLAEDGVHIAQANVARLDAIFTGELINSISAKQVASKRGTAVFFIVADSDHAAFVEFGTGQVGKENSYPYPLPEGIKWEYNSGKSIIPIGPGQYGWFYPGDDGRWYFTQGMPSRPFMYETLLEVMKKVEKTAKEVFN
ncbi:MAG: hypothetical protein IKW14_06090 [Phascolarctobacterium sp.]|nr:hypothetical protein [Phascolarctobacterium sp.]